MQRYLLYKPEGEADSSNGSQAGKRLEEVKSKLFASKPFGKWLKRISGGQVTAMAGETRRFRPGLDYTVAHHGQLETVERLDVTLCFVQDQSPEAKMVWASGDVGGFECYLAAEKEKNVAAEVYCDDDAEGYDLLSVSPVSNTVNIVLRDPGTMRFVKYISGAGLSSRWDVSCAYAIDYSDDEAENEDEDGNDNDDADENDN